MSPQPKRFRKHMTDGAPPKKDAASDLAPTDVAFFPKDTFEAEKVGDEILVYRVFSDSPKRIEAASFTISQFELNDMDGKIVLTARPIASVSVGDAFRQGNAAVSAKIDSLNKAARQRWAGR